MTAEVVKFYPANASDKADNVLEQAMGAYQDVLVIGYDAGGELDVRASTEFADGGSILWLLEMFKAKLLAGDYAP